MSMSPSHRPFLIALGAVGLLIAAGALALVLAVQHYGILRVEVHGRGPGGDDISICMPGALVALSMLALPDQALREVPPEARRLGPLAGKSLEMLRELPDFVLVEVHDLGEHVRIAKESRSLVIDVRSPDEDVHLVVPLSAVGAVLDRLERASTCDGVAPRACGRALRRACFES